MICAYAMEAPFLFFPLMKRKPKCRRQQEWVCFLHMPLENRPDKEYFQKSLNPHICLVRSVLQDESTQRDERITTKIFKEEKLSKEHPPKEQPAYETYILYDAG